MSAFAQFSTKCSSDVAFQRSFCILRRLSVQYSEQQYILLERTDLAMSQEDLQGSISSVTLNCVKIASSDCTASTTQLGLPVAFIQSDRFAVRIAELLL